MINTSSHLLWIGLRSIALAIIFLTRIPIPWYFEPTEPEWGYSVAAFPLVGLVIGGGLTLFAALLAGQPPGVVAVLLLAGWAWITGGLHLDGVADATDAWIGGLGSREKTLTILHDPHVGAMAVISVVIVLLTKYATLHALLEQGNGWAVFWIPVLGRAAIVGLLLTTPYAHPHGIARHHLQYLPRGWCLGVVSVIALITAGIWLWWGLVMLIALVVLLGWLRQGWMNRLGGITGDGLGTACEFTEMLTLILLVVR